MNLENNQEFSNHDENSKAFYDDAAKFTKIHENMSAYLLNHIKPNGTHDTPNDHVFCGTTKTDNEVKFKVNSNNNNFKNEKQKDSINTSFAECYNSDSENTVDINSDKVELTKLSDTLQNMIGNSMNNEYSNKNKANEETDDINDIGNNLKINTNDEIEININNNSKEIANENISSEYSVVKDSKREDSVIAREDNYIPSNVDKKSVEKAETFNKNMNYNITDENVIFLNFNSNVINNHATFIIDSGAKISLLKIGKLLDSIKIDRNCRTKLIGISPEIIETIGTCKLEIDVDNQLLPFVFQVVADDFRIEADGILGRDFMYKYETELSYKKRVFIANGHNFKLYQVNEIKDLVVVPARSELYTFVKTAEKIEGDVICQKSQISNNIYISSCLTTVKNRTCIVGILNISESNQIINIPEIEVEKYHNDSVAVSAEASQDNNALSHNYIKRFAEIKERLSSPTLNSEELEYLHDICFKYSDIFFLEGDKLSSTNAVQHKINTFSNKAPVFVKPYRLPHSQTQIINQQVQQMLADNIIEQSNSPYNAPLLLVPKKNDKDEQTKWRVVVDFRKINEITIADAYPLPNITEILDQLGRSKYFTTLDLASGYHQIPMHPDDKEKTAFSTNMSHYHFLRMPFGLKNSGATFQRLMNNILTGLQGIKCFVYVDDVVLYANTLEEHNQKLSEIFDRFRDNNLKVNLSKCVFMSKSCNFLGHIISENGISPDPAKVTHVVNFKTPQTQKEVKSFLGLVGYYRRFIKDFAKISKPLTELLKKNTKYIWSFECEAAFQILKELITTPPILAYVDYSKPFLITTDASKNGLGAVLSQGDIGADKPIAFASRSLSKAESNYSTTEREMKAIIFAVNHFKPYVFGTKFTICTDHKPLSQVFRVKDPGSRLTKYRLALAEYDYTIVYKSGALNTNADSLSRLYTFDVDNDITGFLEFQEYLQNNIIVNSNITETTDSILDTPSDHSLAMFIPKHFVIRDEVTHELDLRYNILNTIETTNPSVGNILTLENRDKRLNNKMFCIIDRDFEHDTSDYEQIWSSLKTLSSALIQNSISKLSMLKLEDKGKFKWEKVRPIIRYLFKNNNVSINICNKKNEIIKVFSNEERLELIKEYHIKPLGGHQGLSRTYKRIKLLYKWKNMKQDIKDFIKQCESCQKNKITVKNTKMPMVVTSVATKPFERVYLDIVGPTTLTDNDNRYILTFQDELTKYAEAIPIKNQESSTIATEFVNNIVCRHGIPESVLTDQGANFLSQIFKNMCKLLKLRKIRTTAFHPQTNGQLERSHRTITEYLRHFIDKNQTDWDKYLQMAMFTYNTTPHSSTKYTPFELVYGTTATLPSAITKSPKNDYNYNDFISNLRYKFQETRKIAKENIIISKTRSKMQYDKSANAVDFNVGDKILLRDEQCKRGLSKKLCSIWLGPYIVLKKHSDVNYTIKTDKREIRVHANRLKLFHENNL